MALPHSHLLACFGESTSLHDDWPHHISPRVHQGAQGILAAICCHGGRSNRGLGGREIPGCRNARQDSDFKHCHRTLLSDKGALCCAPRTHFPQTLCELGPAPEHPKSTLAPNRKSAKHQLSITAQHCRHSLPPRDCGAEASTGGIITSKRT